LQYIGFLWIAVDIFITFSFLDGETDLAAGNKDQLGWLKEIDMPKDLKLDGIEYLGPQIIET
jgi:hypothetical protein